MAPENPLNRDGLCVLSLGGHEFAENAGFLLERGTWKLCFLAGATTSGAFRLNFVFPSHIRIWIFPP